MVELDSKVVVYWINEGFSFDYPNYGIVQSCRDFIAKNPHFSIKHIFHECNLVADGLANLSLNLSLGVHEFFHVPKGITSLVSRDIMGMMSFSDCLFLVIFSSLLIKEKL